MPSGLVCVTFFDFFSFLSSFLDLRDSASLLKDIRDAPMSMFDAARNRGAERELRARTAHASQPPSRMENKKITIAMSAQAGT
jgi:hypothetical protein